MDIDCVWELNQQNFVYIACNTNIFLKTQHLVISFLCLCVKENWMKM